MRTIAFLWSLKLLTLRTCIFLSSACYLSIAPWAWLCLEWTLSITSLKKCRDCQREQLCFFLSGVARRGDSFSHVAPFLSEGGGEEGPRGLGQGPKMMLRDEAQWWATQWFPNPFCPCRHRAHWLVTRGLFLLARGPCPGPTPHLKMRTSNGDPECVHHHTPYRTLSETLGLIISHDVCITLSTLQKKKLRLREIL